MEHLTLNDEVAAMGGGPQQQQQLPPQMFTTAAQLLDLTDKKLMVALRDGRKLIGVLRSWDQFANLVLQSTIERIFIPPTPSTPGYYADFPRGIFLVRGENVLLLGEIDLDKDDDVPEGYERGEPGMVQRLDKERKGREARRERVVKKRLAEEGFEGEGLGEALL
ncbi:Sm-like ribonucleoprotein [Glarea lozoyensis ATCC 20868]|uniref:U6 snRNA-associated Sm-like protein LSm1 n=1 Tax=Glarea lozoyensis (strain ATCC 20868 / MF5171) TaxID=1116229 RepID=S3DL95_GLAL2|nr:Sm-like ribonucleoprotein [Glarea lozoyensis ATCC 20868]EPE27318.1 Sm-like ribonucleoprotein [Glarea lozoyensis ATCC 20868]